MSDLSSARNTDISNHPYSPSLASSASSSSSSVFSVAISVSSVASSVTSLQTESDRHGWSREQIGKDNSHHSHPPRPLRVPPLPVEQRQHHRRTTRLVEGTRAPCQQQGCPMPPVPALVRQAERKISFVDNLVDSAAQIVETIWPTYMSGKCESTGSKGVLPLRTFIQETLRRSRTSYSTLQVALYYLIVIRPHIPKGEISDMSQENAQKMRALQCGRRMFLAALILASKYLQDRNYSARAWSRISGLQTAEININELAFLEAVNWRLHISESNFQKWTELVVKYTSGPGTSDEVRKAEWSKLILTLTPDLRIEGDSNAEKKGCLVFQIQEQGTVDSASSCHLRADLGGCSTTTTSLLSTLSSPAPVAYAGIPSSTINNPSQIPKLTVSSLLSPPINPHASLPTLEPQLQQASKPYASSTRLVTIPGVSPLKPPAARFGSGAMVSAAAAAQTSLLQRCTTEDMAFLSRRACSSTLGDKGVPLPSNVRSTILPRRTSLSCSMTSSPETMNDSDSSSSSPFAFSRSSSISSASSFESMGGSFDHGRLCLKSTDMPRSSPMTNQNTSESGLNTPTPSPPKYLALRPKASRSFTDRQDSHSPLGHSRKRRVCELATGVVVEKDLGVSPNFSSGMTPQMKVQLQMRTPPDDELGSKRLRCGSVEANALCLQTYRSTEEVL